MSFLPVLFQSGRQPFKKRFQLLQSIKQVITRFSHHLEKWIGKHLLLVYFSVLSILTTYAKENWDVLQHICKDACGIQRKYLISHACTNIILLISDVSSTFLIYQGYFLHHISNDGSANSWWFRDTCLYTETHKCNSTVLYVTPNSWLLKDTSVHTNIPRHMVAFIHICVWIII